MIIALASDHGGFTLKEELKEYLAELNHQVEDFGCRSLDSVDYPDYSAAAARAVARGKAEVAIIICGTGLGVAIAANKIKGIRAVTCHDCFSAMMARAHNDANVLTLGQRVIGSGHARLVVESFLAASFEGDRHQRRLDKIKDLESDFGGRDDES